MLRLALYAVGGIVGLVILVAIVGVLLPKGHRASRTVTYSVPPSTLFAVITDVGRAKEWRSDLQSVEILAPDRFRENGKNGAITFRIETREPDRKLVTRIDDTSLAFGGTWTFDIAPASGGSSLTITEDGEVYNPIFRVMQKLFFSPYATIDTYQADLRKKLSN